MTTPPVRAARLGASLLAFQKWRWSLNVAIWVAIYVLPIIPGLITQAFFNRVSGTTTGGFGVPVLVGLVAAYGVRADRRHVLGHVGGHPLPLPHPDPAAPQPAQLASTSGPGPRRWPRRPVRP